MIFFRFFGYGMAVTSKDSQEHDILNIEQQTRRLQSKSFNLGENNEPYFEKHSGQFFASIPHEFEFMPGDKCLIKN